jgi:hypothetical protein
VEISFGLREEVPGRKFLSQEQRNINNTFEKYASGDG